MLLRLTIAFSGFSAFIIWLGWWMKASGVAGRWNPAWRFIVPIHSTIAFVWIVAAILAGLAAVTPFVMFLLSEISELKRKEEIERRQEIEKKERDFASISRQEEDKRKQQIAVEREKIKAKQRKLEHQRRIEEKRNRTSEKAASAALDEF